MKITGSVTYESCNWKCDFSETIKLNLKPKIFENEYVYSINLKKKDHLKLLKYLFGFCRILFNLVLDNIS